MSTTATTKRRANRLALLVGSNPLPNYLAAVVLEPREVVLLYSPETLEPCKRLEAAFNERQIDVAKKLCIDDATDARKIQDACASLQVDHLHYSGGTKPMAAHARKACSVDEASASYLDDRKGLRFDDGWDLDLRQRDLGLTLDRVLQLHGIERVPRSPLVPGAPTDDDVTALAERIFREPGVASKLYGHFRPQEKPRSITKAKSSPWTPSAEGLSLSVTSVPDAQWTSAQYEAWDDFLCGGWLERWTARQIRSALGATAPVVEEGVVCRRVVPSPAQFEIDVALIRGHRLYVVSCTTEHEKKAICKSKLFEVAMRARHMGGDLARSALVCLLDGSDAEGLPYVEGLRRDIASLWDAPNVPRVFGLADLREWAGMSGEPNLGTLKEWLES